ESISRQWPKQFHAKCSTESALALVHASLQLRELLEAFNDKLKRFIAVLRPGSCLHDEVKGAWNHLDKEKDSDSMCMAIWYWPGGIELLKEARDMVPSMATESLSVKDLSQNRSALIESITELNAAIKSTPG
ncbi:hypothetical protein N9L19_01380, partial [bacterium]|nr:hypothetical protein [bacterium]